MFKNNSKLIFFLVVVLIVIVGLWKSTQLEKSEVYQKNESQQQQQIQSVSQITSTEFSSSASGFVSAQDQQQIPDEQFRSWMSKQVQNLEVPTKNPMADEQNTKRFVNQLATLRNLQIFLGKNTAMIIRRRGTCYLR